jgi:hypothetical protein
MDPNNPKDVHRAYAERLPTCHRLLEPRRYPAPAGYPGTEIGFVSDISETAGALGRMASVQDAMEARTPFSMPELTRSTNHLIAQSLRTELGCPTFFLQGPLARPWRKQEAARPTALLAAVQPAVVRAWLPSGLLTYCGREVYALTLGLLPAGATVDQAPGLLEEMARAMPGLRVGAAVSPARPIPFLYAHALLAPGAGISICAGAYPPTLGGIITQFSRDADTADLSQMGGAQQVKDDISLLQLAAEILLAAGKTPPETQVSPGRWTPRFLSLAT